MLLLALGALVSVGDRLRLPKERRYLLIPVPMEVDDQERGAKFLNRILENIDANGHDEWAGIYRSKTMEVARTWDVVALRHLHAERIRQLSTFRGKGVR